MFDAERTALLYWQHFLKWFLQATLFGLVQTTGNGRTNSGGLAGRFEPQIPFLKDSLNHLYKRHLRCMMNSENIHLRQTFEVWVQSLTYSKSEIDVTCNMDYYIVMVP